MKPVAMITALATVGIAAGIGAYVGQHVLQTSPTHSVAIPSPESATSPAPKYPSLPMPTESPTPLTADTSLNADVPPVLAALTLRVDMPYDDVKARLASAGFDPATSATHDCSTIGEADCAKFPEIEACSGTGAGYCSASFVGSDGSYFNVITVGAGGRLVRIFAATRDPSAS